MTRLVLDTSVAVAWYLPESFSLAARRWRERLLKGRLELVVPLLHYWEFANVLRTYVRRSDIASSLATEIYDLHLQAPLELHEPDRSVVLEVALAFDATAYDAVYIALSKSLDIPLLTAERPTTPRIVQLGDQVELVQSDR
jgi:predicted nucleic acid-binding protein